MATRKQVLVQLTEELVRRIDELAQIKGASRSALVRDAIERYVTKESDFEKDRQLVEAYRRHPPDDELAAWHEASVERLVDEEPW